MFSGTKLSPQYSKNLVRQVQVAMGFGDPNIGQMPQLRQVLRGVAVEAGKRGKAPRAHLPIILAILRKIPFKSSLLWAVSTTNFFSLCRSGAITVQRESVYDPSTHLPTGRS